MWHIAAVRVWGMLLLLCTGCATTLRQAVLQDMDANIHNEKVGVAPAGIVEDDEPFEVCPPGKILHKDCRATPCKVTCEEPRDTKR